jgi:hypothetical protein
MKCRECGAERDPNLKYCDSCGHRQIRSVEAVNMYFVLWFIVLALLFLVESTFLPNGPDAGFLGFYLLIASVDAIIVVAIFLYGGEIVDRIGKAVGS